MQMPWEISERAVPDRKKERKNGLLMQLGYSVFARVRERIAKDNNWICTYCGREVLIGMNGGGQLATIDHKTPLSRGGSWKRFNLTCACHRCNSEKSDMTAEEYMDWRRGLFQGEPVGNKRSL